MKKIKKIGMVAGIFFLLSSIYGMIKYTQPVAKTGSRTTDFHLNSLDLFQEFEQDEAGSNQKYLDKVLEVHGEIIDIQFEQDGAIGIVLDGGTMLFGVSCRFEASDADKVKNFRPGEFITAKGICSGMLSDVVMIRCVLKD